MRDKASRFFKLLGVGLALSLMGFGCRIPGKNTGAVVSSSDSEQTNASDRIVPRPEDYEERAQPTAPVNEDFPRDDTPSGDVAYLRQVFKNLNAADTYKAEMHIPSPAGNVLMEIFYNRDTGIYGKVHAPESQGGSVTDVFIDDGTILYRDETGVWSDITGTEEARNIVGTFANAVRPASDLNETISVNAEVTVDDSREDCTLYHVKQYAEGGNYDHFSICTYADLPKQVTLESDAGEVVIDYYDVNGDVPVYKPAL